MVKKLQDIYATIEASYDPAALKAAVKDEPYKFAVDALEKHFKPTVNKCYKRYLFRQIRQGSESIEQFVVKLRKQKANYSIHSLNDTLVDQIIEGTSDAEFRRKILKDRMDKVQPIIELGKLLESVRLQTSSMANEPPKETSENSNLAAVVSSKKNGESEHSSRRESERSSRRRRCSRCGRFSHSSEEERKLSRKAGFLLQMLKIGSFC